MQHITTKTHHSNCQALWWEHDLGLFCSHMTWTLFSHGVGHELLWMPRYSGINCEAICQMVEASLRLRHALVLHQKIHKRMTEKAKHHGVAVVESKSRPQTIKTLTGS